MRKILFVVLALSACAANKSTKGDDTGSDTGSNAGSDVSDADKLQDYNDIAASIAANLSTGDLPSMVDAVNMAFGRMPAGFTITPKTDYQLLDGSRGGVTVQYKLYCRDSANASTPCNGAENEAHIKPTYAGSLTAASMSLDGIQRTAAWIVRDLGMPTVRLGGSGTDTLASHLPTGDYQLMISDSLKNAVFDPAMPVSPTGGALDLMINVDRTRQGASPQERTFSVTAHIAFIGNDMATLTLDNTQNYTLTISSGAIQ
jgi:hypothetical protein